MTLGQIAHLILIRIGVACPNPETKSKTGRCGQWVLDSNQNLVNARFLEGTWIMI